MEPETEEKRAAREARLAAICESLGLEAQGSYVRPKGMISPVIDASALDLERLAAGLIHRAYEQGRAHGRRELQAKLSGIQQKFASQLSALLVSEAKPREAMIDG